MFDSLNVVLNEFYYSVIITFILDKPMDPFKVFVEFETEPMSPTNITYETMVSGNREFIKRNARFVDGVAGVQSR